MRFKILFFFQLTFSMYFYCQNYSEYYSLIDTANYFSQKKDNVKANEYYYKGVTNYRGFPDDYTNAIFYNYKVKGVLDDTLVKKSFENGLKKKDLLDYLNANKINYNKKKIKQYHKKYKTKKTTRNYVIYKMMTRDIYYRSIKKRNLSKIDSINGQKIIFLLKSKPELFNRFKSGTIASEFLHILMIHSGWNNLESVQEDIHQLTLSGQINRSVNAMIIERGAISNRYVFHFDDINSKIRCEINTQIGFCGRGYSNIQFFYGLIYDKVRSVVILPPTHPSLSVNEINQLRKYLFLSSLSLTYDNPLYLNVNAEEYCSFIKKK